jgi:hypothetical protein
MVGRMGTGELALMWARSSAGKSTWTQNLIRNTPDVTTLVGDMEMTPRRQVEWLAAMTFDLPVAARDIEEILRWPDDPRYPKVVESLATVGERYPKLSFVRPERPTVTDLEIAVEDIQDFTGEKMQRIFIDHMSLMADCLDYTGHVKTAGALHSFAMNHDILVIALQQVGRGGGPNGERNDGHLPLTLSSGVFAGENDADWVFGLYRPDRDPKLHRPEHSYKDPLDMYADRDRLARIRGEVVMQVIKNRTFSDLCEDGVKFKYDPYTRRYQELGTV